MSDLESPVLDILDKLPVSAVVSDASTGKILWTNQYNVALAGATDRSQIIGRSLLEFIRPDQHGIALRDLEAIGRGERPAPVTYHLKGLDGRSTSGLITSTMVQLGGSHAMLSLITDVTLLNRDLETMQEDLDRLRHLVDVTPSGIAVVAENVILYANPALTRALEITGDSIDGLQVDQFVAEECRSEFRRARNEAIRRKTDTSLESLVFTSKSGRTCHSPARVSFTRWEGDAAVMVFLHDLRCDA